MSLLIYPRTSKFPEDLPQEELERLANVPENSLDPEVREAALAARVATQEEEEPETATQIEDADLHKAA